MDNNIISRAEVSTVKTDIDNDDTIKNNNGKLEVEKIKGQTISVDELNTLLGMDTLLLLMEMY